MDRIALSGIRVAGRHGANPGERDREQPFDVAVTLHVDLQAAGASDELDDTVNYAQLHADITHIVGTTSYALLERLATRIMERVFADARVASAEVSVAKPELLDGATPSVTLVRENPRYRASFP